MNVLHLPGIEKLREKLPDYPGKKIAILAFVAIIGGILAYIFLISLDIIPRLFGDIAFLVAIEPFTPILGSIFIAVLGVWMIWGVWNKRAQMKELYGDLAYQKIISRGLTGVALVITLIFHTFTSIRSLPPGPPVNDLTIQWSRSLLPLIGIAPGIDVDGIFFGPADLSADMELLGQLDNPELWAAILEGVAAAESEGKPSGTLVANPDKAIELFDKGFTFVACGTDTNLLARGADALFDKVRSAID